MDTRFVQVRLLSKIRSTYYNMYRPIKKKNVDLQVPPDLIDASLGTGNAGDAIIMHFANKQLADLWPNQDFYRIPKHGFSCRVDKTHEDTLKILCGTNALSTYSDYNCSFSLPSNPRYYYRSVLLLAVGMANLEHTSTFNASTKKLLHTILAPDRLHSVRDSNTVRHLNAAGINNVVNTSCVTMWDLTPEFCEKIPTEKATDVLTTITDYAFDSQQDRYMLTTLCKEYQNVYLWLQGNEDLEKVESLHLNSNIQYIQGGFSGLKQFVGTHQNIDYFGTRLHCGIYCLNNGIRSMIVEVDNRAHDIAQDTNLPTVKRSNLQEQMSSLINKKRLTEIILPYENIQRWKSQFVDKA